MSKKIPIVLGSLLFALALQAENRALLIGIGKYKNPRLNLQGIDKDIAVMKNIAARTGFQPKQIMTLTDEQATYEGIVRAIRTWLIQGAGPADRVLLYYSGHGSSIPDQDPIDEPDKRDEVLVAWDAEYSKGKLINVLVDDYMGELLGEMRSRNVFLIFDACNSGTATKGIDIVSRSMNEEFTPKVVFFEQLEDSKSLDSMVSSLGSHNFTPRSANARNRMNYVGIMAARDDEFANASPDGSVLTLALKRVFESYSASVTPALLLSQALEACQRFTEEKRARNIVVSQHPQLIGDGTRYNAPLFGGMAITPPPGPHAPESRLLEEWAAAADAAPVKIEIWPGQPVYAPRQQLSITLNAAKTGYLYLINVGKGEDSATLLFPNQHDSNNLVHEGQTVSIPSNTKWKMPASIPAGMASQTVLLVAVIAPEPVDLGNGFAAAGIFKEIAGEVPRSFGVEANQDRSRAAGKVLVEIRK